MIVENDFYYLRIFFGFLLKKKKNICKVVVISLHKRKIAFKSFHHLLIISPFFENFVPSLSSGEILPFSRKILHYFKNSLWHEMLKARARKRSVLHEIIIKKSHARISLLLFLTVQFEIVKRCQIGPL